MRFLIEFNVEEYVDEIFYVKIPIENARELRKFLEKQNHYRT